MSEQPIGEVADVRADERIDAAALAAYLRDRLDTGDAPLEIKQFPGGHSNLTYLLRFGDRELVLRRPPLGPVAPKAHDMAREFRVLSELWRAYPPAPRAYLFCDDASLIGASFYVMERRRGVVIRRRIPAELADSADARRRLSEALIDALADLHAVDYRAVGLGDLGKPDGFVERQVRGWAERWQRAKTRELPAIEELWAWLLARIPASPTPALIHNDFKFDNVMYAAGDPGKIVAVFDWEMCTIGDPLMDLGTLLGYWVHDDDPEVFLAGMTSPTNLEGFPRREQLIERYGRRTGIDVSKIAFYRVFACYKTAVVAEQIYVRYVRGQTKDERFAMLGPVVPLLVEAASRIANDSRL
jgi:aminoglycoside phosphotransferase (APT) family kinase protein